MHFTETFNLDRFPAYKTVDLIIFSLSGFLFQGTIKITKKIICVAVLCFAFTHICILALIPSIVLQIQTRKSCFSVLSPRFLSVIKTASPPPEQREEKAFKRRKQGEAGGRGWKTTRFITAAPSGKKCCWSGERRFHFTLIQCEVFKTHKCGLGR